jgi:hypothetical protein
VATWTNLLIACEEWQRLWSVHSPKKDAAVCEESQEQFKLIMEGFLELTDLTKQTIADEFNTNSRTVSRWANGQAKPSFGMQDIVVRWVADKAKRGLTEVPAKPANEDRITVSLTPDEAEAVAAALEWSPDDTLAEVAERIQEALDAFNGV